MQSSLGGEQRDATRFSPPSQHPVTQLVHSFNRGGDKVYTHICMCFCPIQTQTLPRTKMSAFQAALVPCRFWEAVPGRVRVRSKDVKPASAARHCATTIPERPCARRHLSAPPD